MPMFRCRESFVTVDADGEKVRFGAGDLVADDHSVLRGRESLFEPAEEAARHADVEQATSSPGDKRRTRRNKISDDD